MKKEIECAVDHETRLRALEEIAKVIKESISHIDIKMDSQFKWTIGIMVTTFGGLILTKIF